MPFKRKENPTSFVVSGCPLSLVSYNLQQVQVFLALHDMTLLKSKGWDSVESSLLSLAFAHDWIQVVHLGWEYSGDTELLSVLQVTDLEPCRHLHAPSCVVLRLIYAPGAATIWVKRAQAKGQHVSQRRLPVAPVSINN